MEKFEADVNDFGIRMFDFGFNTLIILNGSEESYALIEIKRGFFKSSSLEIGRGGWCRWKGVFLHKGFSNIDADHSNPHIHSKVVGVPFGRAIRYKSSLRSGLFSAIPNAVV